MPTPERGNHDTLTLRERGLLPYSNAGMPQKAS